MKEFIGLLKLPPKLLLGVAIASGLLLFLPDIIILRLYMDGFKEKFGFFVGIAFIVSISILVSNLIVVLWKKGKKKYYDKRWERKRKNLLKNLEPEDKEVIILMLNDPDKTAMLPINNGTVIKLRSYKIITPAGSNHLINPLDMRIPYFVQPWVVKDSHFAPFVKKSVEFFVRVLRVDAPVITGQFKYSQNLWINVVGKVPLRTVIII